jgi:hypothetical protein
MQQTFERLMYEFRQKRPGVWILPNEFDKAFDVGFPNNGMHVSRMPLFSRTDSILTGTPPFNSQNAPEDIRDKYVSNRLRAGVNAVDVNTKGIKRLAETQGGR